MIRPCREVKVGGQSWLTVYQYSQQHTDMSVYALGH